MARLMSESDWNLAIKGVLSQWELWALNTERGTKRDGGQLRLLVWEGLNARERRTFLLRCLKDSTKDKFAWDGLRLISARSLRSGESLPGEVAAWVADTLDNARKVRRTRRTSSRTPSRDSMIRVLIANAATEDDLRPTRNREPAGNSCSREGGSACDLVGCALQSSKVDPQFKTYSALEKIWGAAPLPLSD